MKQERSEQIMFSLLATLKNKEILTTDEILDILFDEVK